MKTRDGDVAYVLVSRHVYYGERLRISVSRTGGGWGVARGEGAWSRELALRNNFVAEKFDYVDIGFGAIALCESCHACPRCVIGKRGERRKAGWKEGRMEG